MRIWWNTTEKSSYESVKIHIDVIHKYGRPVSSPRAAEANPRHFFFYIVLHTRDLKVFWVHDPPIVVAKSAPAAHRNFTRLPNNRPHVLLSLDVWDCTSCVSAMPRNVYWCEHLPYLYCGLILPSTGVTTFLPSTAVWYFPLLLPPGCLITLNRQPPLGPRVNSATK